MFKMFTQMFNADVVADSHAVAQETSSYPAYRCDLITGLRSRHKIILDCFERLARLDDASAVEHHLERLQEAYRDYCTQETSQLYPFLNYHARYFGTDDGPMIRDSISTSRALSHSLNGMINRASRSGTQPLELDALRDQFMAHFRHKQTTVYPLYHKYGIQLMRIE